MSHGTHVTATRQLQSGPQLTSRGAPNRSRNGKSDGIKPAANIPRESNGPQGSLTQHLQSHSTASPQHGPTRPCGPNRPGRPLPSPGPANARRWPRLDRRPTITPRRESCGVDPSVPATPNPRGAPLAMAATCRPVLRRSIYPPLVPNSALVHPSAGAIPSPSILGDSDARITLSSAGLPGRGRERSLTPKGHTLESGGGGRGALCSETS